MSKNDQSILRKNQIINGRYEVNEYIGKGASGEVYKVFDLAINKEPKALKLLSKSKDNATLKKEVEILSKLSFESNVTIIHDYGTVIEKTKVYEYIVLDIYPNGDILNIATEGKFPLFSNKELIYYFREILNGLNSIHDNGLLHKDIKPQNILLDQEWNAFIADYGISLNLEDETFFDLGSGGTPKFMAPEIFNNEKKLKHSKPFYVDIYAIGIMMYNFATGIIPFENFDVLDKYYDDNKDPKIKRAFVTRDLNSWMEIIPPHFYNPNLDENIETIILKAIAKDYQKRYQSVKEILIDIEKFEDGITLKRNNDFNYRPKSIRKKFKVYKIRFSTFLNFFRWKFFFIAILIIILILIVFVLTIMLVK